MELNLLALEALEYMEVHFSVPRSLKKKNNKKTPNITKLLNKKNKVSLTRK